MVAGIGSFPFLGGPPRFGGFGCGSGSPGRLWIAVLGASPFSACGRGPGQASGREALCIASIPFAPSGFGVRGISGCGVCWLLPGGCVWPGGGRSLVWAE